MNRMSLLLLLTTAILAFSVAVQPVKAYETFYIRGDGSIEPQTTLIERDGDIYTFTSDIEGSIVVQRDSIVIDGKAHVLHGTGTDIGIDLSSRTNVVIRNVTVRTFSYGVYLASAASINISRTKIEDNEEGIWLSGSSYNIISLNNITENVYDGIYLYSSSNNTILNNRIMGNVFDGIYLHSSSNNTILRNNIMSNGEGIATYYSTNDRIVHNNLVSNIRQVYSLESTDFWDNGCEGNYWSGYNGEDLDSPPDGVGETLLPWEEVEQYPLMNLFWNPADINNDLKVDIKDVAAAAKAFGSKPGQPKWNPHADKTGIQYLVPDGKVDIRDVSLVAKSFGKTYT